MLLTKRQQHNGNTFLELVIVVVIIGIIVAIAYPSYIDVVRKGRRADAITSLLKLQIDQEKWRANHTSYADQLAGDKCGGTEATGLCWASNEILREFYQITIVKNSANGTGFVATATPRPETDQAHDTCQLIVITQEGPDPKASSDPSCWSR